MNPILPREVEVLVIGAGPTGVTFTKELHEAGVDVLCVTDDKQIGGVFAKSYDSLRLTSSTAITAFSDFSREDEDREPRFWTGKDYTNYLDDYTEAFDVKSRIALEVKVIGVTDEADHYVVEVLHEGQTQHITCRHLAICTGTHQIPVLPKWATDTSFQGEILHAKDYYGPDQVRGKKVCVVGGGEGASDIVLEVTQNADCTFSAVRSNWGHIVARHKGELTLEAEMDKRHQPTDLDTSRLHHSLPIWTGQFIEHHRSVEMAGKRSANEVVAKKWGEMNLAQSTCDMRTFGCKNASAVRAFALHNCVEKGDVTKLDENGLIFSDGTRENIDLIICATGYRTEFSFLTEALAELSKLAQQPRNHLYHHMISPEHGSRIVFGGFARPAFGAIPPMSEMQARFFSALVTGQVDLPTIETMQQRITEQAAIGRLQFGHHANRIHSLTDYLRYMDGIANEIGVLPRGLLLKNPSLWKRINGGPLNGAQYRLNGPGAKPELARERIQRTPMRKLPVSWLMLAVGIAFLERLVPRKVPAKLGMTLNAKLIR